VQRLADRRGPSASCPIPAELFRHRFEFSSGCSARNRRSCRTACSLVLERDRAFHALSKSSLRQLSGTDRRPRAVPRGAAGSSSAGQWPRIFLPPAMIIAIQVEQNSFQKTRNRPRSLSAPPKFPWKSARRIPVKSRLLRQRRAMHPEGTCARPSHTFEHLLLSGAHDLRCTFTASLADDRPEGLDLTEPVAGCSSLSCVHTTKHGSPLAGTTGCWSDPGWPGPRAY